MKTKKLNTVKSKFLLIVTGLVAGFIQIIFSTAVSYSGVINKKQPDALDRGIIGLLLFLIVAIYSGPMGWKTSKIIYKLSSRITFPRVFFSVSFIAGMCIFRLLLGYNEFYEVGQMLDLISAFILLLYILLEEHSCNWNDDM
jgi:hypothetical protein